MAIQIAILLGLLLLLYLTWKTSQEVEELEKVVAQMLIDLGEKGILEVEVMDDDSGEA